MRHEIIAEYNLKMKQPALLFLFIFAIIGSTYGSGDSRLEFSVKKTIQDTLHPVHVTLELKNLTDDTLTFLTNSCNRPSLFSIEGGRIFESIWDDCFGNKTIFLRVLPRQSYTETISVINERSDVKFLPFRIRINLVEPKEEHNLSKAIKEKNKKEFSLWTDYIQFK